MFKGLLTIRLLLSERIRNFQLEFLHSGIANLNCKYYFCHSPLSE